MRLVKRLGFLIALTFTVFISLLPFIWFLFTSLKSEIELTAIPPTILPEKINIGFYKSAIISYNLLSYIKNSLIVAGFTTIICVSIGGLAAYALSRLRLRFKSAILMIILAVAMFPQISIAGPVWRILRSLGWLNTYQGLILPYVALSLPLSIWIMTSFFRELPYDLEEAARVDGCTPLQALYKVILPLAAPGVFTAAILTFIHAWNEFFFALLIMTRPDVQTLPVGIALFQGEFTLPWGEISAASVVATLPLVLLVLVFQRRIVTGLTAGAIKG